MFMAEENKPTADPHAHIKWEGEQYVVSPEHPHVKETAEQLTKAREDLAKAADEAAKTTAKSTVEGLEKQLKLGEAKAVSEITDVTKVAGHQVGEVETKMQEGIKAANKTLKGGKWFGILRSESLGAALSHNLGKEGWKASKGKTLLKGGGVIVGLGAMYDAAFHGQRKDENGERTQPRGALGRWTEFVAGAALTAGSALGGRR